MQFFFFLIFFNIINFQNGGGLVQSYANKADFQAQYNSTAATLGGLNYMRLWIPFTRQSANTMTYVSIYNDSQVMDTAMWASGYPSPGEDCVRCSGSGGCMDDGCSVKLTQHVCNFPLGAPINTLQGLCADTILGEK